MQKALCHGRKERATQSRVATQDSGKRSQSSALSALACAEDHCPFMTLQGPSSYQGVEKGTEAQSGDVIKSLMSRTARHRPPPSDPLLPNSSFSAPSLWFSHFLPYIIEVAILKYLIPSTNLEKVYLASLAGWLTFTL